MSKTERRYDDCSGRRRVLRAGRGSARARSGGSRAFAWLLVITGAAGLLAVLGHHDRQVQAAGGPELHAGVQPESGRLLRQHHEERAGVRVRVPQPDAGACRVRDGDRDRRGLLAGRPLPRAGTGWPQRGHSVRRRLLHLAAVPVAVQHQLAVPVVLAWPGSPRSSCSATSRSHNIKHRHPARPRLAAEGPRWSSTGCRRCCGSAIIGMLILTRWWDFWTS